MSNTKIILFILGIVVIIIFGLVISFLSTLNDWLDVVIIIGIFVLVIVLGYINSIISKPSKTQFKENSEYANAVIYELADRIIGSKGSTPYLYYNYIVDGREYKGWGMWYPYKDTLSVGDTIVIMYNKRDPYKNITKRDFESK